MSRTPQYSPFDATTLADDRREIHQKMRRHMQPEQQREDDDNNGGGDESQQDYNGNNISLNTEGYDSLHQAIINERNNMDANGGFTESGEVQSAVLGHGRRGASHPHSVSAVGFARESIDRDPQSLPNLDTLITRATDRRLLSIGYLILVFVLLFSYCFFLFSHKLMHYALIK